MGVRVWGPSGHAELVPFRVQHYDVSEGRAVVFLADNGGTERNEFGYLGSNQSLPDGHVPGAFTGYADVDVYSVLRRLAFRHPQPSDGRALALRIDDGRAIGVVITRFRHVAEGRRPEVREQVGILRVTSKGPVSSHDERVGAIPDEALPEQPRRPQPRSVTPRSELRRPHLGRSARTQRQTSQVLRVSSGVGHDVCPGGVFVVGGVGLQAAVQDADEAVGELAQCGFVADLAVAELVVVGGGSW